MQLIMNKENNLTLLGGEVREKLKKRKITATSSRE